MKTLLPLIPLLAAMLAGCQYLPFLRTGSEPKPAAPAPASKPGIGQAIDPETGQAYYVVCDPCLRPTPKTRMPPPAPVVMAPPAASTPMPVPETTPAPVTAVAAPTPPAESVKPGPAPLKRYVPFAFGRVRLGPQGRDAMATVLEEAKSAERIHVRGYTDIIGKMPENKTLAMSRAAEVRTYLIKGGVDQGKITTSYCIDCFIESNESEEGRATNRQALVVLSSAKSAPGAIDMDRRDPCRLGSR